MSEMFSELIPPTTNMFISDKGRRKEGGRNRMKGPGPDYDKCHTLNHMFLLKLSDRPKEDLWVGGIFVFCFFSIGSAMDVPWHSQHQFKHSWPAQGNSSTFIRNAKVTLKMQFINPRQWAVFFILLWKINVIELEGCQCRLLLVQPRNTALILCMQHRHIKEGKREEKSQNTSHDVSLT